ncbi:hypothetical protein [Corynebacterium efficiens YS-314]|uniref:Glutaredoxin domain-containing protein n=2 Tax=Corynebacterium efficiens TaxID=152794 RepID=Q8FSG1_COREF|nr:hypothetical protein [Corynebacterium efficiens YS-314]
MCTSVIGAGRFCTYNIDKSEGNRQWVLSSRSVVSACPRRSTARCCVVPAFSVENSASRPSRSNTTHGSHPWVVFSFPGSVLWICVPDLFHEPGTPPVAQTPPGDAEGRGGQGGDTEGACGFAQGTEITHVPSALKCLLAQLPVRVDGDRGAHHRQHRQVIDGIGVGGTARKIEFLNGGQRRHRVTLTRTVEDVTDESPGEDPVPDLRDGADGTGEPEALGEDLRQLDGGGADQPHLVARSQVHIRQLAGAGPGLVEHGPVHDLLTQFHQFLHGTTPDELQGLFTALCHIVGILGPGDLEFQLFPDHREDLMDGEELLPEQALGEDDEGGTLDEGVVHIEEGRGPDILGDIRVGQVHMDRTGRLDGTCDGIHTRMEILQSEAVDGGNRLRRRGLAGLTLGLIIDGWDGVILDEPAQIAPGGTPVGEEILRGAPHVETPVVISVGWTHVVTGTFLTPSGHRGAGDAGEKKLVGHVIGARNGYRIHGKALRLTVPGMGTRESGEGGGNVALHHSSDHRVELIVRDNCGSCVRVREQIMPVLTAAGVHLVVSNVDDDPALKAEFGDRVPVILVDDEEFASWEVDNDELAHALL